MGYYYQVYTGSGAGRGITPDEVFGKLPDSRHVDAIIVGWSDDRELYRRLRIFTRQRGIKLWLWFPVFSEHAKEYDLRQQINIRTGEPFGAKVFDGDETFDFCCPSQPELTDVLLKKYETIYEAENFDGIFLDRIRYPSLTMGVEALFGCRCDDCKVWFAEKGLSDEDITGCYERVRKNMEDPECINPLGIISYREGSYEFEDPVLSEMLRLRAERITGIVSCLAEKFREKGLYIGTDLFAPFLADFVGQDYTQLGHLSDFAKPMLYRFTDTPAGVHFELQAMARALSCEDPVRYAKRLAYLRQVLGLTGEDTEFFRKELFAIKACGERIGKENTFVPGIELHTAEDRPPVEVRDIRANVTLLAEAGFENRVACWDILCVENRAMEAFIHDSGVKNNE